MPRSVFSPQQVAVLRLRRQGHPGRHLGWDRGNNGSTLRYQAADIRARITRDMAAQLSAANVLTQEDLRAQQRILEDIFMHASAHSRTCESMSERVRQFLRPRAADSDRVTLDPPQIVELSDGIGRLEMAVRDLCAKIAPAAVERARLLANVYPDPDQQLIFDLEGERLDNFLRPLFAEAGIASDLLCDAELNALQRSKDDQAALQGTRR